MGAERGSGGTAGAYRYVSLGFAFAGGIILFMAAGYGLDRWLGTLPFGTVIGTLVGAWLGFVSVYRRVMGESGKAGKRVSGKAGKRGSGRSG